MIKHIKSSIIILLLSLSIGQKSDLYNISFNEIPKITITKNYYNHSTSNSQIVIDSTLIDIFEFKFICSDKKLININIKNEEWITSKINPLSNLPSNQVIISEPLFIRGTPIIKIQIIPFQNKSNHLQYLSKFNMDVTIKNDLGIKNINFIPNNIINKNVDIAKINTNTSTEYLIISDPELLDAANNLKTIHSIEVPDDDKLSVEVVSTEVILNNYGNISPENIRSYLLDFIEFDYNHNLKYILLMGDEISIPPYYYNNSPTDDYFTSNSTISLTPQIPTGRIPTSNLDEALNIVEQIQEYLITPNQGAWKSKAILLADDQNHPNQEEFSHSLNSNILYEILKDDLNFVNLYGTEYSPIPSNGWYSHPELTHDIISNINNGAALINYIGHGNATSLAHENILDLDRDLNLVQSENQAIWIVGTCSFGFYDNNECMAENLLIKDNGSIALITSTRSVYASTNIQYLTRIFNLIQYYMNDNDNDNDNLRLGDIFYLAKESSSDYLFQLFGDPALKMIIPKKSEIIDLNQSSTFFEIGQQNNIYYNQNSNLNFSITINGPEKYNPIGYSLPGDIIFQGDLTNNPTSFFVPLDITQCDTCSAKVTIFSESIIDIDYKIDSKNGFQIINNDSFEQIDDQGPKIHLWHSNTMIENSSLINYPFNITITLSDDSGINLTGGIGHNLKYIINDDSYIANQLFNYIGQDSGFININLTNFDNWPIDLEIQAWDNFNNFSSKHFQLFKNNDLKFNVKKIFNYPNPFKSDTYFTFMPSDNADIDISIYSINGNFIKKLNQPVNALEFTTIYWDGKDESGNEIPNGTYFYYLKGINMYGDKFNKLEKLTKIK